MEYLLYPNLMSRQDLIRILKDRQFKIPNLDELETQEIKKIYSKFALPLSQRESKTSSEVDLLTNGNFSDVITSETVDCPKNRISLKRNLSVLETNKEVSHSKIIKLSNNNGSKKSHFAFEHKRILEGDDDDCNSLDESLDQCQQKLKRQKITWP